MQFPSTAGKWQGALVAIKVVEHRLRRSLEEMDEARESLLSASVSHPNVVREPRASCLAACATLSTTRPMA